MLVVGMPSGVDLPLNHSAEEGFMEHRVLLGFRVLGFGFWGLGF